MNKESLKYQIGLTLIPGVGNVLAKNLISYTGSPEAVFKEKKSALLKIPGVGSVIAEAILQNKEFIRAEEELKFIQKYNIKTFFYTEKDYPHRLQHCVDSPVLLYYKGEADLNTSKIIGVVGTRNATGYGKEVCSALIEAMQPHNVIIVSGLAYGIDIHAHKSSLKNHLPTIGVLGHGLDRIYPSAHKSIAEKMVKSGGLLTEFLSKTNPDRENFPKRNRIIAGLVDALIVVEAGKTGGALITAEIANSYNRDVFAVPGRIKDTFSEGCNFLIKTNKAILVESFKDIEYIMRWQAAKQSANEKQKKLFIQLNQEEEILVKILNESEILGIDSIFLKSQMPMSKVATALLNLEFSGVVKSLPGKRYQLA